MLVRPSYEEGLTPSVGTRRKGIPSTAKRLCAKTVVLCPKGHVPTAGEPLLLDRVAVPNQRIEKGDDGVRPLSVPNINDTRCVEEYAAEAPQIPLRGLPERQTCQTGMRRLLCNQIDVLDVQQNS